MGLLSWLKSKTKREKKPRKPPEVPTAAQQEGGPSRSGSGEDEAAQKVVIYPLFDPRHVTPRGSGVPLLEQRESLTKQLTSIPTEMPSGELITLPRSKSSSEDSEPSAQVPELAEEEEEMPLMPLDGDQSPLSGMSMEAALAALTRKLSRAPSLPQQQQEQEQPVKQQQEPVVAPRPASPQRPVTPPRRTETVVEPPPKPREKKQSSPEPQRVRTPPLRSPPPTPPKPSPTPVVPETIAPLPLPPKVKSSSSSSRSSSSRSSRRSRSSKRSSSEAVSSRSSLPSIDESSKSETSLDIEDMPTAPTTPRMPSRVLQHSKQPRLLLLQPHIKPHPATTRMQREGRRCLLSNNNSSSNSSSDMSSSSSNQGKALFQGGKTYRQKIRGRGKKGRLVGQGGFALLLHSARIPLRRESQMQVQQQLQQLRSQQPAGTLLLLSLPLQLLLQREISGYFPLYMTHVKEDRMKKSREAKVNQTFACQTSGP
ncbi:hypothetical protein Emed_005783 [Eimeria media]